MSDSVGVVIPTYGKQSDWETMAARAIQSVLRQTRAPDDWVWIHSDTLRHARNDGAEDMNGLDWLLFLDADDELDPLYIENMLQGHGDIRRPSTLGVYEDGTEDAEPVLIPPKDLSIANYIVIGAMCRASVFWSVGGFRDWPCLEDWDLWRRMVAAGAVVGDVPDAIYRVHVRSGSRNQDQRLHAETYRKIRAQGS